MKYISFSRFFLLFLLLTAGACSSDPLPEPEEPHEAERIDDELIAGEEIEEFLDLRPENSGLPVSAFNEIWGYLLSGREESFHADMPITDIAYFGAEIDSYGRLTDVPDPKKVKNFKGRIHMVVACNSRALTHFVLLEGRLEREELIADILSAARPYDGLQIDFELVPQQDGRAFLSFLAELRMGLRGKFFTIALPARNKTVNNDVYDYEKIKPLVDRILVMAYDEHWSTSAPGPIASMGWCRRIADYSLKVIGSEKLIMGIPFYGRAWGNIRPSKAYLYSGIENIMGEYNITEKRRENGSPTFEYDVQVSVKVYYEDDHSLAVRMEMYKSLGVRAVGFWRLGQETPAVWNYLKQEENRGGAEILNP